MVERRYAVHEAIMIYYIVAKDYTVVRLYLANWNHRTLTSIWTTKREHAKTFDRLEYAHNYACEIGLKPSTYDVTYDFAED